MALQRKVGVKGDAGHQRFMELLSRQNGNRSSREIEEEITNNFGYKAISYATISRLTSGESYPSMTTIKVIARYLGIPEPRLIAILEGTETSYVDVMPIKTAEDVLEALGKADLPDNELLRVISGIGNYLTLRGRVSLTNALFPVEPH